MVAYGISLLTSSALGIFPSGDTTGATDTAAIKAALATPGGCSLGAGQFYYNATLTLGTTSLTGRGWGATQLNAAAPFTFDSSAAMINVTSPHAVYAGIQHLGGPSTAFASNPGGNFIQLQPGAQYAIVEDWATYYQNGYELEYVGGAGTTNIIGTMIHSRHSFQSKAGMHLKGSAGSSWNGQVQITDIQAGQLGGDSLFLEDIQDISIKGHNDSVTGSGGGYALHVKGNCAYIYGVNLDLGVFPGPGTVATALIEDSVNGSPHNVHLWGEMQAGLYGLQVTGGANEIFLYMKFHNNQQYGAVMAGTGANVRFLDCTFSANNQAAASNIYDLEWSGSGTPNVKRCTFLSTVNATPAAGTVANPMDFSGSASGWVIDCDCLGPGTTAANVFTANTPGHTQKVTPYNPHGNQVVGVPASGTAIASAPYDRVFYITANAASSCACQISGTGALVTIPAAGFGVVELPSGLTFTPTYGAGDPPTWTVNGN